ncbi:MAG: leucine-rich repeat domain-containing protein [Simkaniaceae bacterium]|nr:leucine-rich repeat domain-containing protein [Simkaniaceae bacterium]
MFAIKIIQKILNFLRVLELSENRLCNLPEELIMLKNLKILDLNDNQLSTFSSEFVQLKNLRTLILLVNPLDVFPGSFAGTSISVNLSSFVESYISAATVCHFFELEEVWKKDVYDQLDPLKDGHVFDSEEKLLEALVKVNRKILDANRCRLSR